MVALRISRVNRPPRPERGAFWDRIGKRWILQVDVDALSREADEQPSHRDAYPAEFTDWCMRYLIKEAPLAFGLVWLAEELAWHWPADSDLVGVAVARPKCPDFARLARVNDQSNPWVLLEEARAAAATDNARFETWARRVLEAGELKNIDPSDEPIWIVALLWPYFGFIDYLRENRHLRKKSGRAELGRLRDRAVLLATGLNLNVYRFQDPGLESQYAEILSAVGSVGGYLDRPQRTGQFLMRHRRLRLDKDSVPNLLKARARGRMSVLEVQELSAPNSAKGGPAKVEGVAALAEVPTVPPSTLRRHKAAARKAAADAKPNEEPVDEASFVNESLRKAHANKRHVKDGFTSWTQLAEGCGVSHNTAKAVARRLGIVVEKGCSPTEADAKRIQVQLAKQPRTHASLRRRRE